MVRYGNSILMATFTTFDIYFIVQFVVVLRCLKFDVSQWSCPVLSGMDRTTVIADMNIDGCISRCLSPLQTSGLLKASVVVCALSN